VAAALSAAEREALARLRREVRQLFRDNENPTFSDN
jgi:hypothetical protein